MVKEVEKEFRSSVISKDNMDNFKTMFELML